MEPPRFHYLHDAPAAPASMQALRVLMLADTTHPSHVVLDHIQAITTHSCHRIDILNPRNTAQHMHWLVEGYQAIIIHYSIFLLYDTYLPAVWRGAITRFTGQKMLLIEDEYQQVNAFKACMAELGFQTIISALNSPETMQAVYGGPELPHVAFYCGLPGYITEAMHRMPAPVKLADRPLDIVYRGRTLPAQLGKLAHEKRSIGDQVKALAPSYGLSVDIAADEESRIYGDAWPRFLMRGRAMLGVEGGASIFDFDGTLAEQVCAYQTKHPTAPFEEIWSNVLREHEGNVMFRTITPKFFEAIAARTALLLYPGDYNGILKPHRHYIPLARDGSNMPEVVQALRDIPALEAMTERAYQEVLLRPDLQMNFYVKQLDAVLYHQYQRKPQRIGFQKACIRLLKDPALVLQTIRLNVLHGYHTYRNRPTA